MTTQGRLPDVCAQCGAELEGIPEGGPCPTCGATDRHIRWAVTSGVVTVMGSEVSFKVSRVWDAFSLAFAGVIYGIVATVFGVVVARIGPAWLTVVYAVATLAGLVLGLTVFHQQIIGWMRKLPAHPNRSA